MTHLLLHGSALPLGDRMTRGGSPGERRRDRSLAANVRTLQTRVSRSRCGKSAARNSPMHPCRSPAPSPRGGGGGRGVPEPLDTGTPSGKLSLWPTCPRVIIKTTSVRNTAQVTCVRPLAHGPHGPVLAVPFPRACWAVEQHTTPHERRKGVYLPGAFALTHHNGRSSQATRWGSVSRPHQNVRLSPPTTMQTAWMLFWDHVSGTAQSNQCTQRVFNVTFCAPGTGATWVLSPGWPVS